MTATIAHSQNTTQLSVLDVFKKKTKQKTLLPRIFSVFIKIAFSANEKRSIQGVLPLKEIDDMTVEVSSVIDLMKH